MPLQSVMLRLQLVAVGAALQHPPYTGGGCCCCASPLSHLIAGVVVYLAAFVVEAAASLLYVAADDNVFPALSLLVPSLPQTVPCFSSAG